MLNGVRWINTAGDMLTALSCFALVASLLYLARKYRVKHVSSVFLAFGLMFFAFGLRAVAATVLWWYEEAWVVHAATFFRLTGAVCVAACAFITARCAGRAFFWLRELAALERRLAATVAGKRGELREHGEWAEIGELLGRLKTVAKEARELTAAPERE